MLLYLMRSLPLVQDFAFFIVETLLVAFLFSLDHKLARALIHRVDVVVVPPLLLKRQVPQSLVVQSPFLFLLLPDFSQSDFFFNLALMPVAGI